MDTTDLIYIYFKYGFYFRIMFYVMEEGKTGATSYFRLLHIIILQAIK